MHIHVLYSYFTVNLYWWNEATTTTTTTATSTSPQTTTMDMQGSNSVGPVSLHTASQASHVNLYKNLKSRILKCCASIYFNKLIVMLY